VAELELEELGLDGLGLDELELDALGLDGLGLALDPAPALPDVLPELAPPLAWSFFESLDIDAEPEAEPDGDDGEAEGEVVEPADDEAEPDGEAVEPAGEVREVEEALSARSHAATRAVPRATETASAIVLNLMRPPWLGYPELVSKERAYLPSVLKSRCCSFCFGSTCPCWGLRSTLVELLADDGAGPDCGCACGAEVEPAPGDVWGRGSPRSHAASKARENAATTIVVIFIQPP
jgi:hypothetical protein